MSIERLLTSIEPAIVAGNTPHVFCELEAPRVMMVDGVFCTFKISAFAFASVMKLTCDPESNKARRCTLSPDLLWMATIAVGSRAPAFRDQDPQCPVKTENLSIGLLTC